MTLPDRYREYYMPLLRKFCKELTDRLPADNFQGIPHPQIPLWGSRYEQSLIKIAFIGLETRGYNPTLNVCLKDIQDEKWNSSFDDLSEFQNLDFVAWTKPRHYDYGTFWGFVLYFLATLYGIENWKVLKQCQHANILNSFVWGEATAIEKWDNVKNTASKDAHTIALEFSGMLNDYQHLKNLFAPQVSIICTSGACENYLRNTHKSLVFNENGLRFWKADNDLIFNIPHPDYLHRKNRKQNLPIYAERIRETLIEEGYFQPFLPFMDYDEKSLSLLNLNVFRRCIPKTTEVKDAIAYIATELRKQNAKMTVRLLCYILNQLGYRTKYGSEYQAGVGSYHTISLAYRRYSEGFHQEDIAKAIADAFTKPNGDYAWH